MGGLNRPPMSTPHLNPPPQGGRRKNNTLFLCYSLIKSIPAFFLMPGLLFPGPAARAGSSPPSPQQAVLWSLFIPGGGHFRQGEWATGLGYASTELGLFAWGYDRRRELASKELNALHAKFGPLALGSLSIDLKRDRFQTQEFALELTYKDLQSPSECVVHATTTRSELEAVAPGGGGFRIIVMWDVKAELGPCSP